MGQSYKQTQWRPSLLDRIADGLLLVAFILSAAAFAYVAWFLWAISGFAE